MNKSYATRMDDPFRDEIEWRLERGEKPYTKDNEPHVLAGDTYLVDDGNGIVHMEIG